MLASLTREAQEKAEKWLYNAKLTVANVERAEELVSQCGCTPEIASERLRNDLNSLEQNKEAEYFPLLGFIDSLQQFCDGTVSITHGCFVSGLQSLSERKASLESKIQLAKQDAEESKENLKQKLETAGGGTAEIRERDSCFIIFLLGPLVWLTPIIGYIGDNAKRARQSYYDIEIEKINIKLSKETSSLKLIMTLIGRQSQMLEEALHKVQQGELL